jgi:hypothetical protein
MIALPGGDIIPGDPRDKEYPVFERVDNLVTQAGTMECDMMTGEK